MKKQNYVPTTLGQYLNENKSITLTRQYGNKPAEVVGSRAPLRNQILSFVAENQQVSRLSLKRFIAGLNETSKNPAAAANMWLKRNSKFFIAESKGGVTTYKLSKLGEKLITVLTPSAGSLSEERTIRRRLIEKKENVADKYSEKEDISEEEDDDEMNESREDRIQRIVEQIRAKRAHKLNEAEDEEIEDDDEEAEEDEDEEEAEEETEEVEDDEETEDDDEESEEGEDEEGEDDDRVEITEFVITVDDIEEAIAELAELGITAEAAAGEVADVEDDEFDMGGEETADDFELADDEGGEDLDMGGEEEVDDFDLDLGGDFEGEEPEVDESVTGMEREEKAKTPNLTEEEDDDEFTMDNLDDFDAEDDTTEVDGEEEDMDMDLDSEEDGEDLDLGGEDMEAEAPVAGNQIKVSAENWDVLKGWLEGKGVDIEEMFGGEIEVEGEEGVEDEINFDDLEDAPDESEEHEAGESDEEEAEEEAEGDDDEEVEDDEEEEVEESAKPAKKGGFQPGKKGVNPFPKKK